MELLRPITTYGVLRNPPAWIECTMTLKSIGVSGPPMRASVVERYRYGTSVWFGLWHVTHRSRFSFRLAPCRLRRGTTTSPCFRSSWQPLHFAMSTICRRWFGSTAVVVLGAGIAKSAVALFTGMLA